jgi:hypothetical protein
METLPLVERGSDWGAAERDARGVDGGNDTPPERVDGGETRELRPVDGGIDALSERVVPRFEAGEVFDGRGSDFGDGRRDSGAGLVGVAAFVTRALVFFVGFLVAVRAIASAGCCAARRAVTHVGSPSTLEIAAFTNAPSRRFCVTSFTSFL